MPTATMTDTELDQLAINTIRTLSMDAVQAANSGHPGTPMALAPLVYTLWNRVMRFDPAGSDLARPRSVCALEWPRLDAAMVVAAPDRHARRQCRLRASRRAIGHPRRYSHVPPVRQQGSGTSRVPPGVGRRNHHRAVGTGRGDQCRHGDRRAVARRPLQPPWLRAVRLQRLRRLRRRLPDGRRRLRGRVARRPPGSRSPLLDFRQQPDHDRGQHRHRVHRGCRDALPRAMAGTCYASAMPTTSCGSSMPFASFNRPRAGPR